MTKSKTRPPTYQEEKAHNEMVFDEMLRKMRPDIWVLKDIIDRCKMNPMVIFKFIRQVSNLANGSRFGKIELVMQDGVVMVIRGIDSEKIGELAVFEDKASK